MEAFDFFSEASDEALWSCAADSVERNVESAPVVWAIATMNPMRRFLDRADLLSVEEREAGCERFGDLRTPLAPFRRCSGSVVGKGLSRGEGAERRSGCPHG